MPTAFGRAMLATINGQPQRFRMTMQGNHAIDMDCRAFLTTRPDEAQLLDGIELPDGGAVLDVGCGTGRHLARVRQRRPQVHCWGVDICDLMLDHCQMTIADPATFVRSLEELADCRFDLIMLMGNGLGVLGHEEEAVSRLRALVAMLAPAGRIVIETGNPFGHGYCAPQFTIDYDGSHDGPFTWGYSDREWITRNLRSLGCHVKIQSSGSPGGLFFFAIGEKGEQGALRQVLRDAAFYPCSGLDGAPVKFLAKRFQQFFYADYHIGRDAFFGECERRGFLGYRASTIQDLDVHSVFGCSWDDIGREFRDTISRVAFGWSPSSAFVAAVHFERLPKFSEDHGPPDFDLLFARCEAIATFRSVFSRRGIAPRCLAYIRSGIAFGGNFSEFPQELERAVRDNRAGLPDFMLYDQTGGDPKNGDFLRLVKDYERMDGWDYHAEGYGQSHLTFARRRGGGGEQVVSPNGP